MMAWKCDRCGKFYIDQTTSQHYVCDVETGVLDFCEECHDELEDFMSQNGGDEIAETNI